MNTLIHADIFFLVSTICFVVLAILLVVVLVMVINILSRLKKLSERAEIEGNYLLDEVHSLADRMKRRSSNPLVIFFLVKRLIRRYI